MSSYPQKINQYFLQEFDVVEELTSEEIEKVKGGFSFFPSPIPRPKPNPSPRRCPWPIPIPCPFPKIPIPKFPFW